MRRRLLPAILLLLPLLFPVACRTPAERSSLTETTPQVEEGEVEVFTWWTGGSEADALANLIRIFNLRYPDLTFVNPALEGEGGMSGQAELSARLDAGNVPDSWQESAGQELLRSYVAEGRLEPLNFLYEDEEWLPVLPERLLPYISVDNLIYSVPVNIHRANVLWYNVEVLEEHDLAPPQTMEEWIAAMERLRAGGMEAPLVLGESWTALHLLETVLLATLKPELYDGLWSGESEWEGGKVTETIATYEQLLAFTNADHADVTWEEGAQRLARGEAAFYVMGDWVEGYFRAELRARPGADFGWAPVPGTDNIFQFLSDSFVLPVGAPNRKGAIAWLRTVGSREGQNAFNQINGSIPARTDVLRSVYDEYQQSAIDAWSGGTVVGSLTHGVVAPRSWQESIEDALVAFLDHRDIDAFQFALFEACQDAGPCH